MLPGQVTRLPEGGKKPLPLPPRIRRRQQHEVLGHDLFGRLIERHEALLAALAAHGEHAGVALGR
jgi:hypothetical protein